MNNILGNSGCSGCFGFGNSNNGNHLSTLSNGGGLALNNQSHAAFVSPADPDDEPSRRDVDKLIASELNKLSMEERERAMNDVHGVQEKPAEENPELITACFQEIEKNLQQRSQYNTAYDIAATTCPEYVSRYEFRLLFLRSARYDPKVAAEKMANFFEIKKELWGVGKLCKDITLDDFDEDDMACLRTGYGQIAPLRDMAGRPIVVFLQKLRKFNVIENAMRVQYYLFMSVMESEVAQKMGIVTVFYHVDLFHNNIMVVSRNGKVRNALPINFASLHFCYNDPKMFYFASLPINMMETVNKIRYRPHFGSHVECLYSLTGYGIPINSLPVNTSGELQTEIHLNWIENRMKAERQRQHQGQAGERTTWKTLKSTSSDYSVISSVIHPRPTDEDVLFGRGKTVVDAPGNVRFRQIVDMYADKYEAAGRLEKTCMAEIIVRIVKDANGGRFLKREEGDVNWVEVEDAIARKKVAHAFRNKRKAKKIVGQKGEDVLG